METREQLFDRVWSKTLSAVSTELGISAPVLRQLCMEQEIPLPWHGSRPSQLSERPALPEKTGVFDFTAAVASAINSLHFPGETAQTFQVPAKLTAPSPLIVAAQKSVTEDHYLYGLSNMFRTGFGQLSIRATQSNMDRALRIMDTLVKAW